jgi:hypothetical protein
MQVWLAHGHKSILASVLISNDPPVIIMNQTIAGTPDEMVALLWACEQVAEGVAGFFVKFV